MSILLFDKEWMESYKYLEDCSVKLWIFIILLKVY